MPERFRGKLLTMERYTNPASIYLQVITSTKFKHFWITRFFLSYAPDKQTNKQSHRQTDEADHPTHADQHSRRA